MKIMVVAREVEGNGVLDRMWMRMVVRSLILPSRVMTWPMSRSMSGNMALMMIRVISYLKRSANHVNEEVVDKQSHRIFDRIKAIKKQPPLTHVYCVTIKS